MSNESLKMINVQPSNPPQEEVIAPLKPKTIAKVTRNPYFHRGEFIINIFIQKDGVGQLSLSNLATWHGVSTVEKMVPEVGEAGSKKTLVRFRIVKLTFWYLLKLKILIITDCLQ